MPLTMNRDVFITCAVTGSGGTQDKSPNVPRSPEEIANSAIDAAKAGAAVVHCHVRDPETGAPSRDLKLYRELTDRIRDADVDVVLNLTAGMGGDIVFGSAFSPGRDHMPYAATSVLAGGNVRVGLEDNLFLERDVLATNARLVEKAVGVIEGLGANIIGPQAVRDKRRRVRRRSGATLFGRLKWIRADLQMSRMRLNERFSINLKAMPR